MTSNRRLVRVELVSRTTADSSSAGSHFLELHHLKLRNHYNDGTTSKVYNYDAVMRPHLDAVVVAPFTHAQEGTEVLLRSNIRPPILLRHGWPVPFEENESTPVLWELPAGLLEPDDRGSWGIQKRAAIEMLEETGFRLDPSSFHVLPGGPFLSAGTIPERLYFAVVEIADRGAREEASGDGSPVEDGAQLRWIPLDLALEMALAGEINDVKTDLGLRKMASFIATREK